VPDFQKAHAEKIEVLFRPSHCQLGETLSVDLTAFFASATILLQFRQRYSRTDHGDNRIRTCQ